MFPNWVVVIFCFISLVKFDAECNNTTISVIPIARSQYDRLMVVRRNYWKVRCNHDLIVDHCRRMHRFEINRQINELQECHSRLRKQGKEFGVKLKRVKSEINSLTRYRYLNIVKNQITEFDQHAINFAPNVALPLFFDAKLEEIRRQRWVYLFENRMDLPEMKNLTVGMAQAGIHYRDFSARIARGFEMLVKELRAIGLDDVTVLEELPDFNRTVIGDAEIDTCLVILMKDYENRGSIYWQD